MSGGATACPAPLPPDIGSGLGWGVGAMLTLPVAWWEA